MGSYRTDTFTGLAHTGNVNRIKNLLQNPNVHSNIESTEGGIGYESRSMTALGIAARRGDIVIMDLLLDKGKANPDGTGVIEDDIYCATPLFAAVQGNQYKAVAKLLEAGADVDCSMSAHGDTDGGATAMYYAAQHNDVNMAAFLHMHGACLCIPAGNGYAPLDIARKNGHTEVADWIEKMSTHFVPDLTGTGKKYTMVSQTARPHRHHGMGSIGE